VLVQVEEAVGPGQSHYRAKKFFVGDLSATTEHAKDFS
jgi:hypothetical protein